MEIPQDLVRLFSIAVRDAVWYKDSISALLRSCGVPPAIVRNFNAKKRTVPTVQLVPEILGDLQALGPEGDLPLQRLFTQMCNWKDFSSLDAEKRTQARASVEALRSAHQAHLAEVEFAARRAREE
jgi:hypothetical protein